MTSAQDNRGDVGDSRLANASASVEASRVTPMMAQYVEIKAANPDCLLFYRMGDFYELFFGDAEIASRALGIVLTKRGRHLGQDIPMCGVPIERSDEYLHRLIALGHRVAVCEQTEDPAEARKRGPKSVVRRAVVRIVTPGTLTEDQLLEPRRANILLGVARGKASDDEWAYGLAALDISTGAFFLVEVDQKGLLAELARIEPAEIVACDPTPDDARFRAICQEIGAPLLGLPRESEAVAERRLKEWYGVSTLDGFGSFSRLEMSAGAVAIAYLERTQIGARPRLDPPRRREAGASLEMDAATRANLEISRTLSGVRTGSLVDAIDVTRTSAGSRLLAERIASPVTDPRVIDARFDAVEHFVANGTLRAAVRDRLRGAPDFSRALSRVAIGRGGPRDLAALRDGLMLARGLAQKLDAVDEPPERVREARERCRGAGGALVAALSDSLAENLPLDRRAGGFIRAGFSAALDEARRLRTDSRRVIAELQTSYCAKVGIKQLKVKHNNFLGYFVETPLADGERLLKPPFEATFRHRQTMADAMRFSTDALAALESDIASAEDRALTLELDIYEDLAKRTIEAAAIVKSAAEAIAEIDLYSALAEAAEVQEWVRPKVDRSLAFVIEDGRHPVVERVLKATGAPFVPNSCDLSGEADDGGRMAVVTGPNMAGKSTFLRQNALIAALAQAGSFVPARRAHIGVIDRLFSRVGAADDLARGRSTFMVEMIETAVILNQATPRSLVILDEIGRGTATFDGLAIAWASAEHLHEKNRSRTLFATHFHELTQLAGRLPRVDNLTMRVAEWGGDVVFLHEVTRGAADRSYGIQVAKLAGLPQTVVERAKALLTQLETNPRSARMAELIDDLPLFAAGRPKETEDRLRAAILALDLDATSPRAALEQLYALKRLAAAT